MDKSDYKRAFDSIYAPEDTEERVLSVIRPRPKRTICRTALILCAVLILISSAALAAGAAGDWLNAIVQMNGRSVPEGNLQTIHRTVEGDGLRITLDSIASDGVHTYFLMNIEAINGQDLSNIDPETIPMEDSLFADIDLTLPSSGGYSLRILRIDDGSDPMHAQLVLKVDFGVPRNGARIYLTIENLSRGFWTNGENGEQKYALEPVAEGEWTFSVRLNANLDGVHYKIPGYDFDISISPLGMAINGVGSGRISGEAYLLMQDGSKVELVNRGLSSGKRNGETYREQVSYEFAGLIDADRAAKLVVDGYEFELIPVR